MKRSRSRRVVKTDAMGASCSIDRAILMGAQNGDIAIDNRGLKSVVYVEAEWRRELAAIPGIMTRAEWTALNADSIRADNGRIYLHHMYGMPPEVGDWKIVDHSGEVLRRFRNPAQVDTYMSSCPYTDFLVDNETQTVYKIYILKTCYRRSPMERLSAGDWFGV